VALIILTYIFVLSFSFIVGKFLKTRIRIVNVAEIIFGFFFSITFMWAMLYIFRDISLYDLHRRVIVTTLGLHYIIISGSYFLVYLIGIWAGNISEDMGLLVDKR